MAPIIQSKSRGDDSAQAPDMDIQAIRQRARQDIEAGAVTADYAADAHTVVRLLNEALATEIVCVLRYRRHYFMAKGILSEPVAAEFMEHAQQEQEHADSIAERIVQLGAAVLISIRRRWLSAATQNMSKLSLFQT